MDHDDNSSDAAEEKQAKRKGRKPGCVALYQQIATKLKTRLENQEWGVGERLPSARQLAIEFGVGRQVIQMAIDELRIENWIRVDKKGHAIVKAFRCALSAIQNIVAIVVSCPSPWTTDSLTHIVRELHFTLSNKMSQKYSVLTLTDLRLRSTLPPDFKLLALKGIFLVGRFTKEVLRSYSELDIPCILIDFLDPDWTGALIAVDNIKTVADATTRLLKAGHQRIAFVRYVNRSLNVVDPDSAERQMGFQKALREAGIKKCSEEPVAQTTFNLVSLLKSVRL